MVVLSIFSVPFPTLDFPTLLDWIVTFFLYLEYYNFCKFMIKNMTTQLDILLLTFLVKNHALLP